MATALTVFGFTSNATAQVEIIRVHGDDGLAIQEGANGDNWETAYKYLQDALARAADLLAPPSQIETVHIWVAATDEDNPYRPHMCSEFHAALEGNPNMNTCLFGRNGCAGWSFHLQNNVEIYGGFPPDSANELEYGTGGASKDDRNWEIYTTVLSGDLDGNSPVNHDSHFREQHDSARAATLLATALIDETALIDGFTIQSSRASAFIAIDARPRVLGCIFASSTRTSAHLPGESVSVFHRCRFESPMHEPFQAEAGAEVHCLD